MSYKVITLALLILISFISAGKIIPDAQNPVQILLPTISGNPSIILRFSLATPLKFSEVIGVTFASSLNLDFSGAAASGTLTDNSGNYYNLVGTQSDSTEKNIAFFKLADTTYPTISAGLSLNLQFGITAPASPNFINSIGVFTATNEDVNRILIDSIAVLGSGAVFPDISGAATPPLQISSVVKLAPSGSTGVAATNIYSSQSFDVNLTMTVNSYISNADHVIVITYPSSANVTAPTGIVSYNTTTDATGKPLAGASNYTVGTDPSDPNAIAIYLTGVSEDLSPTRSFILTLTGFTAGNTPTAAEITVKVYYRNTYILTSSSSTTGGALTTKPTTLTVTASHVEGWDLIRNGAWPITFTITAGSAAIPANSYVVIQNKSTATSLFSFVASTCDFSNSSSNFDNTFSGRNNCYALRTNQGKNTSDLTEHGSGIFFRLGNQIAATTGVITITVWGYVDACGGDNARTVSGNTNTATTDPLLPSNAAATVSNTIDFTVNIYTSIDTTQTFESRFSSLTSVASANSVTTPIKCWNSIVQDIGSSDIRSLKNTAQKGTSTDVMFYRETSTWDIANETGTSAYLSDVTATFTPAYLYNGNAVTSGIANSFFSAKVTVTAATTTQYDSAGKYQAATNNVYGYQYIPTPYTVADPTSGDAVTTALTKAPVLGHLEIYFSGGCSVMLQLVVVLLHGH